MPFRCHRCHSADHLVVDYDQCSHGFRRTNGRKVGTWEEEVNNKKEKCPLPGTFHLSPEYCPTEKEISQSSQLLGGLQAGMERGTGLEDGKQDGGAPAISNPPSGMIILSSSTVTSYITVGSENVLHDLNLMPQSMPALNKILSSRNVECTIPKIIGSTPAPLVAFCSMEGSSSGNNSIAYDLTSQTFLVDPSPGLGKLSKSSRGRGGGFSSRGQGRKSKMDHAKVKALFDQEVGTHHSITGALRASDPLWVGS